MVISCHLITWTLSIVRHKNFDEDIEYGEHLIWQMHETENSCSNEISEFLGRRVIENEIGFYDRVVDVCWRWSGIGCNIFPHEDG